ncbi:MAG: sensor histidine kinase [Anaerolineales bacterium]|nr:sensor histidine kinase [Anaerolineales bacterium]
MDITIVYLVYGLAFFSMGLAIMLEAGRSPLLAEANVLRPLAIFGFVHGAHEWLEMILDKSEWFVFRYPQQIGWLRLGILTLSFASLIVFGLRMFDPRRQLSRAEGLRWGSVLVLYIVVVFSMGAGLWHGHEDHLAHIDAIARYLLAFPGALLAGLALHRQAKQAGNQDRPEMAVGLRWAGWGFLIYSCTQVVAPPLDVFPANLMNTATFTEWMGVPVQVFRAAMAVVITLGLLRAMQAAEAERQRQLLYVQQARLDALEQVRQELGKREAMRQELMRHTVLAQEDERARIARELHDETAQVLTAFSLHLAALLDAKPGSDGFKEQVDHLQALCRQMSLGLYRLVNDLRPAQLDDLGLAAALAYLVEEMRGRMNLQVTLEIRGERQRRDSLIETALYRVAQEALINVARHAGVNQAQLQVEFAPQAIHLLIGDQGVGFDPQEDQIPPRGWGLAGMRERVNSIDGQFILRSSPGQGTLVEVKAPFCEEKEKAL